MKKHWTQTVAGRAKLRRLMKAKHAAGKIAKGKRKAAKARTKPPTVVAIDVKSAVVYLQQAEGKGDRMARALAQLALLTLLGEDR